MNQDDILTHDVMLRRCVAWGIDALLIAVICAILWVAFSIFGILTLGLGFPLLGLLPAVPVVYNWLFVAGAGATPGQSLLGLIVCRDEDLGRPGSIAALVQAFAFYLTLGAGVIWLAVALITTRHRTLHDMASGLVVVRIQALTEGARSWNMAPGGRPIA